MTSIPLVKDETSELIATKNLYRNLFERSKDVIYITNKNGDFIDFNKAAINLFGYTKEELKKLNAKDLYVKPEDRLEFEKVISELGEVVDYEITLVTKNGEKIDCLLTCISQPDAEGKGLYQGIVTDVTKRKKDEKALRDAEKLALSARIARTVAHEVRNPLTNINLSVEQLKNEIESPDETLTMYFDIISRNSERINQMITELLNSSKPALLNCTKNSFINIIETSLASVDGKLKEKNITIERNFIGDFEISVDAEKINTALTNILINAIEAMEPGKGILTLSTYKKNDMCYVTIKDNGKGVSKENLNNLFEPFFTKKQSGMGLGLTSAHNIILNHKGTIEVTSNEGEGTLFIIGFNL